MKLKTYKFRCYLNSEQQILFKDLVRNNVFVYNYIISMCNNFYYLSKRENKKSLFDHLKCIDSSIISKIIQSSNEWRISKGFDAIPVEDDSFFRIKEKVIFANLKTILPEKQYKECQKINSVWFDSIFKKLNERYPLEDNKEGKNRDKWSSLTSFITTLRKEFPFLKENSSQQLGTTCRKIEETYKLFFKRLGGLPKIKTLNEKQSITYNGSDISKSHDKILFKMILPKWDFPIQTIVHRPIEGHIQTVTLSKVEGYSDQYFISIQTKKTFEKESLNLKLENAVGIDPGVKTLMSFSDGTKYKIPEELVEKILDIEKKMIRLNRSVSRKYEVRKSEKKVVSNRESKVRKVINELHRKKTDIYKNYLHKISLEISQKYDFVFWEATNEKELVAKKKKNGEMNNKNLRIKILKAQWYTLSCMIEYKMKHQSKMFERVEAKNTTQTCSECGHIKEGSDKMVLGDNVYECSNCGMKMDRDLNAAKNILKKGIKMVENVGQEEKTLV